MLFCFLTRAYEAVTLCGQMWPTQQERRQQDPVHQFHRGRDGHPVRRVASHVSRLQGENEQQQQHRAHGFIN